jgi:hypothetical protein
MLVAGVTPKPTLPPFLCVVPAAVVSLACMVSVTDACRSAGVCVPQDPGVHDLVLCARSRVLAVWCRSGETLVWEFSTVGREAAVKVRKRLEIDGFVTRGNPVELTVVLFGDR